MNKTDTIGESTEIALKLFANMLAQQTMYNRHEAKRRALECCHIAVDMLIISSMNADDCLIEVMTELAKLFGYTPKLTFSKSVQMWNEVKEVLNQLRDNS
jgi:hypothetical protein